MFDPQRNRKLLIFFVFNLLGKKTGILYIFSCIRELKKLWKILSMKTHTVSNTQKLICHMDGCLWQYFDNYILCNLLENVYNVWKSFTIMNKMNIYFCVQWTFISKLMFETKISNFSNHKFYFYYTHIV